MRPVLGVAVLVVLVALVVAQRFQLHRLDALVDAQRTSVQRATQTLAFQREVIRQQRDALERCQSR